ncbi:hypothetical protein ACFQ14_06025 [Pseudahrensia aquimaris]|uniref:Uncharacterized protein n=1 Tax=Pseudahrensia aquimaris TaxID=744461 RepID=A0ABW3FGP9_9HYPH
MRGLVFGTLCIAIIALGTPWFFDGNVKTEVVSNSGEAEFVRKKTSSPPFDLAMEDGDLRDVKRRESHWFRKSGSESQWLKYGVTRLDSVSFYVGLWMPKNGKPKKRDIRKKLRKGYKPITDWGKLKLQGPIVALKTRHGPFEVQRFVFESNARPQSCVYYQSVSWRDGLSVRGHHCVRDRSDIEMEYLACKLSSVSSPRHRLLPQSGQKPCGEPSEDSHVSLQ